MEGQQRPSLGIRTSMSNLGKTRHHCVDGTVYVHGIFYFHLINRIVLYEGLYLS